MPSAPTKAWGKYLVGSYSPAPRVFASGKGAILYDRQGRDYVDFASGIAVSSLGHGNKALSAAIAEQAARLIHVSNLFVHDGTVRVARKLVRATGMEKVFFCNSGAEANECALKIARKRGVAIDENKFRVIALEGSFHGRVGMSLAATANTKYRDQFGPLAPGFEHVPADDVNAINKAFDKDVCAAMVEPIQGESGLRKVPDSTLQALRELCDANDALLIVDEIQTGMGRTGKMLASDGKGLRPDIVTLGKGIGGGFPVAAALVARKASDVLRPGDHGTTYGGNALALAAVEVAVDHIARKQFLARVAQKGKALRHGFLALKRSKAVLGLRGKGLLLGLELDADRVKAAKAARAALDQGVLTAPAGDNVLRLLPPLTVTLEELDSGLHRLGKALRNL